MIFAETEFLERLGSTVKENVMRVRNWLKTVPALAIIGTILFGVLAIGGALLLWGSNFADDMVHDQLRAQRITFPQQGAENFDAKTYPGLQQYAGQAVDSGPKAKAYANEFIAAHLQGIGGGKTYSQLSAQSLADPSNTELQQTVQTMFRGETLRGLLLYAWGWSVVAAIAYWVGIAALLGALGVLAALVTGFLVHERQAKHADAGAPVAVGVTPAQHVPAGVN
jgi:hypothetical protein